MRSYVTLLLSAGAAVAALAAAIVVHGGWEAGAAGIGMLGALGFLLSMSTLLAMGDRPPRRGTPAA